MGGGASKEPGPPTIFITVQLIPPDPLLEIDEHVQSLRSKEIKLELKQLGLEDKASVYGLAGEQELRTRLLEGLLHEAHESTELGRQQVEGAALETIGSLKKSQVKAELKQRQLPATGPDPELRSRLLEALLVEAGVTRGTALKLRVPVDASVGELKKQIEAKGLKGHPAGIPAARQALTLGGELLPATVTDYDTRPIAECAVVDGATVAVAFEPYVEPEPVRPANAPRCVVRRRMTVEMTAADLQSSGLPAWSASTGPATWFPSWVGRRDRAAAGGAREESARGAVRRVGGGEAEGGGGEDASRVPSRMRRAIRASGQGRRWPADQE